MSDEFTDGQIERAWEPAEEVVMPRVIAEYPGLQPEDIGVLIALLLREPGKPASVLALSAEFQALGWRMGASRLRGVMDRLKKAGHVRQERSYDKELKRPVWGFQVYRNPANNRQYVDQALSASSQVAPIGGFPTDPVIEKTFETSKTNVCAGQADRLVSNGSAPIGGFPTDPKTDVSAGQADRAEFGGSGAHPPHPPEEEDSSSPYPLTGPVGSLPSQREEEAEEFSSGEIREAEGFLQQMKRWQAGGATARKNAPRLLRVMRQQGWPSLAEMDEEHRGLLEAGIFRNTGGAKSWNRCLPGWIDDLRLYSTAKAGGSAQGAGGRERCPDHPARYRTGCLDCALSVPA
ncbi:hypothetical protein [Streptomyces gibsoniae]|uniref:Helix-turn-helix domain-containing protein n=1 Tax=Streptomyces gibsoniae TaxID=3075529 RepID=A0ABU2U952_9ACTN|nr:hypothetical protein [Streptomyces sp. DSM 41699]MDT0469689.1 hypothetical protein [Streptomyces sp. DSM 41699]